MRRLILSLVVLVVPAAALAQEPTQEERDRQQRQEREMQQPLKVRQDPLYEKERARQPMTHAAGKVSCRADKIIGANVKDTTGKQIGTIKDLAIDPGNGRFAYGVLSFGGFLGMGDKYFAIPWGALQCQSDGTFQLDVTEAQLKEMEGFDKNNWPDMANPRWATTTHQRFGQRPYWETHDPAEKHPIDQPVESDPAEGRTQEMERQPTEMERQPGQLETLSPAPRIVQGTQLIGASVKDNKQESVGNIKDLLLDTSSGETARVSCAVLSFGGFLGMGDKLVAVPFQKMTIQPKADDSTEPRDIDSVVVNVDKEQLKNAPSFTDSSWPREDDREYLVTVYRFYNVPTYW